MVTKIKKSVSKDPRNPRDDEDEAGSDDEQETGFSTESTVELMMQLQDVLAMSFALRWQIFDEEYGFVFSCGALC